MRASAFRVRVWQWIAAAGAYLPGPDYDIAGETFYEARAALARVLGVEPQSLRLDPPRKHGEGK